MKYLLVVTVVLVAFWIWRQNRRSASNDKPKAPPKSPSVPQIMVSCRVCGTHLPQTDAVAGQRGAYCSREHWAQAEQA